MRALRSPIVARANLLGTGRSKIKIKIKISGKIKITSQIKIKIKNSLHPTNIAIPYNPNANTTCPTIF